MPTTPEKNQKTVLTPNQIALLAYFDQLSIIHETHDHAPIFTVEEGKDLKKNIPGAHGKSLFLTNKTGQYWLVITKDDTRTDLKALSDYLETKRFSFAKADKMQEYLGVTPGSVTPFALINDQERRVHVIIDKKLTDHEQVVFHPLKNDKSTVIKSADLIRFINSFGYKYQILTLDGGT